MRGPSCGDPVCPKFQITADATRQTKDYVEDAIAFALEHGLPVPAGLL